MKKDNNLLLPFIVEKLSICFDNSTQILDNLSFSIEEPGIYGLTGASGSGKTTLLNIISGILKPQSGIIKYGNINFLELKDDEILKFRKEELGFIFQESHLIDELDILENIGLKGIILGENIKEIRNKTTSLLKKLGMENLINRKISFLSTGERVRVSILRAIYNFPSLIIADEPTGNLDSNNTQLIMELLKKIVVDEKITLLIATHDRELFPYFDNIFDLKNINGNKTKGFRD